jgi:hypothetical protein
MNKATTYKARYTRGHLSPKGVQVTFNFTKHKLEIEELPLSIEYNKIKDQNRQKSALSLEYEDAIGEKHTLVFTGDVKVIEKIYFEILARRLKSS